jgi:hypothetical protein
MREHTDYANGLREIADWIEAHPEVEIPENNISCYTMNTKADASRVLRSMSPCKKEYSSELFQIKRKFGPITLSYVMYRKAVCVAKVVGKKVVPETREPARTIEIPEKVTPEHTEDIIEWDCTEPLLTAEKQEAA